MQLPKSEQSKSPKMKTPKKIKTGALPATPEVTVKTPKTKTPKTKTPAKMIKSQTQTPNKQNGKTPTKTEHIRTENTPKQKEKTPQKQNLQSPKVENTPSKTNVEITEKSPDKLSKKQRKALAKGSPAKSVDSEEKKALREIQVYFPPGGSCYKDVFLKVISEAVIIRNPKSLILKFDSAEEAQKQAEEIQKISIGGKTLGAKVLNNLTDPLQKTILLKPEGNDVDVVLNAYGAESIHQLVSRGRKLPIHVLTFKTKESAENACSVKFNLDGRPCNLRNYFQRDSTELVQVHGQKRKAPTTTEKPKKKAKKEEMKEEEGDDDEEEDEDDEEEDDEDEDEDDDDEDEDDDDDDEEEEE